MSQKKAKLLNKFLKARRLDDLVTRQGNLMVSVAKSSKRFYQLLTCKDKATFSLRLKDDHATAK